MGEVRQLLEPEPIVEDRKGCTEMVHSFDDIVCRGTRITVIETIPIIFTPVKCFIEWKVEVLG
jgi:hypothetical protein